MSESRKDVLVKALEAEVGGASVDLGTLFTDDVVGWSPYATVSGLTAISPSSPPSVTSRSPTSSSCSGDSTRWATRRSPNGSSKPITPGHCVLGEDAVVEATGRHVQMAGVTVADFRGREDPVVPDVLRRHLADRADRRRLTSRRRWSSTSRTIRIRSTSTSSKRRSVVRPPPPWDSVTKSTWRSSCATPARSSPASADGPGATAASCRASGWSQVSEVAASRRGSSPPPKPRRRPAGARRPSTSPTSFQARRLYERNGYELVGRVEDFPSGTDVLWYRKRLNPPEGEADPPGTG